METLYICASVLDLYNKIGVPVQGIHCKETEMHEKVVDLIDHFRPDILVITGHDAYTKSKGVKGDLAAYRHSRHFVQAVREVRKISIIGSTRYFCWGVSIAF